MYHRQTSPFSRLASPSFRNPFFNLHSDRKPLKVQRKMRERWGETFLLFCPLLSFVPGSKTIGIGLHSKFIWNDDNPLPRGCQGTIHCGILNHTWHYLILVPKLIQLFFLHYIDLCVNKIQLNIVGLMNTLALNLHFPEAFLVFPASDPTTLPTDTNADMQAS